jgi:hypothetical protein
VLRIRPRNCAHLLGSSSTSGAGDDAAAGAGAGAGAAAAAAEGSVGAEICANSDCPERTRETLSDVRGSSAHEEALRGPVQQHQRGR